MKIRNGFVSNSSSSSFIVVFPHKPKSADDVKQMMFPKGEKRIGWYENTMTTDQIALNVFKDIEWYFKELEEDNNKRIKFKDGVIDCLEVGGDEDLIMAKFYPELDEDSEEYDEIRNQMWEFTPHYGYGSRLNLIKMQRANPDKFVFQVEYSDDSCGLMEHGEIFRNVVHERISNH